MKRGEIWLADLAPRSGSEQRGTRPVIIVSSDVFNLTPRWQSFNIVPLSTSPRQARRSHTTPIISAGVAGLPEGSVALCHQLTTLDRSKFIRKLGELPTQDLQQVELGIIKALQLLHHLP